MVDGKIEIEIWGDIVCPFCLVGKKSLEKVITILGIRNKITITPRSFQLEPDFPKNIAKPSIQHLSENKGYPIDEVKAMCAELTAQGHTLGVKFDFDAAQIFNTFDAHKLVKFARSFELDEVLNDALMHAYASEGIDLSERNNLIKIVDKLGLDTALATAVLTSHTHHGAIDEDRKEGLALGLQGVPFFRINKKQVIAGMQNEELIKKMLEEALRDKKISLGTEDAPNCTINGNCS